MSDTKYWMATVSKEHTVLGVQGGFIQVCHGKSAPLKRMKKGDFLIVYSSKISFEGSDYCQAFTAIGQVIDDLVYPYKMNENFVPFRRNINFEQSEECLIRPLINDLHFIQNKKAWGYPFRYGFFEIIEQDFNLIASKMIRYERY